MRLVIWNGVQYDADNLPSHVPADEAVSAEKWFADNAKVKAKPESKGPTDSDSGAFKRGPGRPPKDRS